MSHRDHCWSLAATLALKFQHLGHVTSSVTWQLDQQFMVSYRLSVITILHGYGDLKTEGFWSYDLDLLIWSHVTTGLAVCGFLQVVN